jgi:hypothetical protein
MVSDANLQIDQDKKRKDTGLPNTILSLSFVPRNRVWFHWRVRCHSAYTSDSKFVKFN